mmetsp:Transcript_13979/g.20877  ORF Transcript_13979/g.20877 Transcript_13979/m.20877 type:complete len:212 (+) Transcript_13979:18-653(+)
MFFLVLGNLRSDGKSNGLGDISRGSSSIDLDRNITVTSLYGIYISVELFKSDLNLLLCIITALFKTGQYSIVLRWRESHVVNLSSIGVSSTSYYTLNKNLIGYIEEKEAVSLKSGSGKSLGLSRCTRESVKKPSVGFAVVFLKTIADNSDNNIIRNKLSSIHGLLCLETNFSSSSNSSTEHVSSTKMNYSVFLLDNFTLSSLSTSRSSRNN